MDIESRRKQRRGWALVTTLFLTAGLIAFVRTRPDDPQDMIDALVRTVEANHAVSTPRQLAYRHKTAYVAFLPNHGYHLTAYVGRSERFAPGKYVVVNRVDDELSIDVMAGSGEENVHSLRGAERQAYIDQAELDLSDVDSAYERLFTTAGLELQQDR